METRIHFLSIGGDRPVEVGDRPKESWVRGGCMPMKGEKELPSECVRDEGGVWTMAKAAACVLGAWAAASTWYAGVCYLRGRRKEANRRVVERLYAEVWNQERTEEMQEAVCELVSAEHVLVDPSDPMPTPGRKAYWDNVVTFRQALPKFHMSVDNLIAEGDYVVAQVTVQSGKPATSVESCIDEAGAVWTVTSVLEIKGDKVCKSWVNSDSLSALIQLGLVPDIVKGPFARKGISQQVITLDTAEEHKLATALLGREEAHPKEVLTHDDWLDYFEKIVENSAKPSLETGMGMRTWSGQLRTDQQSGLDFVS